MRLRSATFANSIVSVPLLGAEGDLHAGVEPVAEALGDLVELTLALAGGAASTRGFGGRRLPGGRLGGAHRQVFVDDLGRERLHRVGVAGRQDRAGVPGAEHPGRDPALDRLGQLAAGGWCW